MSSIVLNGTEIELPDSTTLALTLSGANLQDPSNRGGAYSNSIKLPRTNSIKAVLENADKTNAVTNLPYFRMTADIMDGGAVFQSGSAILKEIKEENELFFLGSNSDWGSQLGDKTLQDLNLSALAHGWTEANVHGSRANTWSDGYIYPNIDYGLWTYRNIAKATFNELYPAIFGKWLFRAMLQQLGYTVSGLWWYASDANFDSWVIPFSNQNFVTPDYKHLLEAEGQTNTDHAYTYTAFVPQTISPYTFDVEIVDQSGLFDLATYTVQADGYYDVLTYFVLHTHGVHADYVNLIFYLKVNGSTVDTMNNPMAGDDPDATINKSHFLYLQAGDTVSIDFYIDGNVNSFIVIKSGAKFNVLPTPTVVGTANLHLAKNLPPITLKEFVKFMANRFGLVFMTDNYNKDVRVEKFDSIKSNIGKAKDWSDKLDLSEKPRRSFAFKDYAQQNWLKWKEDKADINLTNDPTYGNYHIDVANTNIATSKDLYTSVFAATKRIKSFNNIFIGVTQNRTMASLPIYKLKANIFLDWFDPANTYVNSNYTWWTYYRKGYWKLKDGMTHSGAFDYTKWDLFTASELFDIKPIVPRVGYIVINSDADQNIYIEDTSAETDEPQLYFENLHFQNAITGSYVTLGNILDDTRVVEALFHLSKVDIVNYLETKSINDGVLIPIWLVDENGDGNFYYINEIKQFKVNKKESCWVELVRI